MASVLLVLLLPLVESPDPTPADKDVTAGWTAALVFLFLIAAVAVLARSFVMQLRKAQAAREAGVYGDRPASEDADQTGDQTGEDAKDASPQRRDAAPQ